jgi:hypothetical protein
MMKSLLKFTLRLVGVVGAIVLLLVGFWMVAERLDEGAREQFMADDSHRRPLAVTDLGEMPGILTESSGIAVSQNHPGVLWSHNDSGDRPRFFQIDMAGTLGATYLVEGAGAVDWESMDLGPCPVPAETSCVYAADIGDNSRRRDTLTLYVIAEPDPSIEDVPAELLGSIHYSYPDERYDAEAFAVAPDGTLIVITKGRTPDIWLFQMTRTEAANAMASGALHTFSSGIRLPIEPDFNLSRVTTGAAVSPDGSILAVRTYSEIYFFAWPVPGEPVEAAPICFLGTMEPQGEAIAFGSDGTLLLTSEDNLNGEGHLLAVRCAGIGADGVMPAPSPQG